MRACLGCGLPEQRGKDLQGRPTLNLNPINGLCVHCTITAAVEAKGFPPEPEPFDPKCAAANDRE